MPAHQDHEAHSEKTVHAIGEILGRKQSAASLLDNTRNGLRGNMERVDRNKDNSPEDLIFDLFRVPGTDEANIGRLIKVLRSFGLREKDPRLRPMVHRIREFEEAKEDDTRNLNMDREQFKHCIHPSANLISRSLCNELIIPSWFEFRNKIEDIFNDCREVDDGEVASYIPQLARQDPNLWGMSICTIDGQRVSFGDAKVDFCIQSVSKAFNYAIVASDIGADELHSYVGHEPSGRFFNDICLDPTGKPHNPMINSGAILTSSLIKSGTNMADRFDFVLNEYKKMAGGEHVGFNNATFLSERDSADRNYALSYYMKENKCFPPNMKSLREELDLYFQLCSLETNCDTLSVMAATLANGGMCPLTQDRCVSPRPCRDVLSLMYSCGMYDLSGKFAFQVGLPAKSGVSGVMIVVVPNLMGIALFSPKLDKCGNSSKGVAFCRKLIQHFNFHNYDSLVHADTMKLDPRSRVGQRDTEKIISLLFAAKNGEFETVRRMYLQGNDLNVADYDGRTALHIAASEGHPHIVQFLVEIAKANTTAKDRWGRTPLDDARQFKHDKCVLRLLSQHVNSLNLATTEEQEDSSSLSGRGESSEESSGSDDSDDETKSRGKLQASGVKFSLKPNGVSVPVK